MDARYTFPQKVLVTVSIIFLFLTIFLILKGSFNIILLMLAGALIAVYFRGISYYLSEKTKMSEGISLLVVIVGTIFLMGLIGWQLGSKIQLQVKELETHLPDSMEDFKEKVSRYDWAKPLLERSDGIKKKIGESQKVNKTIQNFFTTTFGVLGDVYVIVFIGIFFTATPRLYVKSIISLIPPKNREKGEEVLRKVGFTLRSWLAGQIFAMIIVAILTGIGLLLLDIPMALALAMIAGILNFIPNFGPVIAMIPAALVALSQGTTDALLVVGLYVFIQVAESNLITPLIQKKLIEIPPAYIIIAQILIGSLTGAMGIILATPIIAIIMVLIQELYIKKMEKEA